MDSIYIVIPEKKSVIIGDITNSVLLKKTKRELKTLKQFKEEVDNLAGSIQSGKVKKTIRVMIQEAIGYAEWENIEKFEARKIIEASFATRGVSAGYMRKCLPPGYKYLHQARTKKDLQLRMA